MTMVMKWNGMQIITMSIMSSEYEDYLSCVSVHCLEMPVWLAVQHTLTVSGAFVSVMQGLVRVLGSASPLPAL